MTYEPKTRSGRSMFAGSILVGLLVTRSLTASRTPTRHSRATSGATSCRPLKLLTITLEGESLYAQTTGQAKYKLVSLADHRFSLVGSPRELVFTVGGDGKASSVTQTLDGATQTAKRTDRAMNPPLSRTMDPAPLADAVLASDLELVRKLVADGADIQGLDGRPEIAGANGRRPLNFAGLKNDTKMIELLLELGRHQRPEPDRVHAPPSRRRGGGRPGHRALTQQGSRHHDQEWTQPDTSRVRACERAKSGP